MVRPGNVRTKLKRRQHAKASREAGDKAGASKVPKEARDLSSAISKKGKKKQMDSAMSDINAAAAAMSVDALIRDSTAKPKAPKKGPASKKKRSAARKQGMKRRKGAAHKQRRKGIN